MHRNLGFTLLEIAIVIIIIGLIAAGVVGAQTMIRNSHLQALMSEAQMYNAAIKNFQAKYMALPGDFSTAETVWGAATTDNGDGDGNIEFNGLATQENLHAWRHLGLSGFINQNYDGTAVDNGSCDLDISAGNNIPASRLSPAGWNIGANSYSATPYTGGAVGTYFPMSVATDLPTLHALWVGGDLQVDGTIGCAQSQIPMMTAEEAYVIDQKYDDAAGTQAGSFTGKIRAQYNNTGNYEACEDLASAQGAYNTTAVDINCSLVFLLEP